MFFFHLCMFVSDKCMDADKFRLFANSINASVITMWWRTCITSTLLTSGIKESGLTFGRWTLFFGIQYRLESALKEVFFLPSEDPCLASLGQHRVLTLTPAWAILLC